MGLQGLFASAFLSRAVPVAASVVVHASLATGLVLGAAGHARAGVTATSIEIDVDVTPETPAAPAPPPREEEEEAAPQPAKMAAAATPPTHHHDYPVPPSHDATPHDPNLVHDHADDHDHDHDAPAQAAPALAADSSMPRFTIASGSAPHASGGSVSASGSGNGAAPAAASPSASSETLPVSAVQVPATLAAAAVAAYPPAARSDDREGDVGLEIVVDGDGRVLDAHLTRPAGHGFDESALEAIRRYRFVPAKKDGRAVRVRMPWIVQFRLR